MTTRQLVSETPPRIPPEKMYGHRKKTGPSTVGGSVQGPTTHPVHGIPGATPAPQPTVSTGPTRRVTKRARNAEAKDERRADILRAALDLFSEHPYGKVTMAALARHTGLAKGTVYLYFDTKEAVFLALLLEQLDDWYAALSPRLEALPADEILDRMPDIVARSLATRPSLIRLLGLLHTTLERNVEVGLAREFKQRHCDLMAGPAKVLEDKVSGFAPGAGAQLMMRTHALVVGIGQMANPSASAAAAIDCPELAVFKIDFEGELREMLRIMVRGWPRAA